MVGDGDSSLIFNLLCNHPKGVTCEIPHTLLILSSSLAKATALRTLRIRPLSTHLPVVKSSLRVYFGTLVTGVSPIILSTWHWFSKNGRISSTRLWMMWSNAWFACWQSAANTLSWVFRAMSAWQTSCWSSSAAVWSVITWVCVYKNLTVFSHSSWVVQGDADTVGEPLITSFTA